MKSHKRNQSDRAYSKGYMAGVSGKSRSLCPFGTSEARHIWLSGWREGRSDHWNGYNTLAQAQKLSNL